MTALTPQQMRELANEWQQQLHDAAMTQSEKDKRERTVAAFRTAADQLEAVEAIKQYVEDGEYENDEGERFVYTYSLRRMLGLTADTAPERHHPACGALDEPCHCVERGDAPQEDRDDAR